MNIKKIISAFLLITFSTLSFSQIEAAPIKKEKKNSVGIEIRNEYGFTPNVALSYRRFFENSKYNFNANFAIGQSDRFRYRGDNSKFYRTGDSLIPLIGVSQSNFNSSSYQTLELGIERKIKIWKLNFIAGVEGFIGHRSNSSTGQVYEAELVRTEENGLIYENYEGKFDSTSLFGLNHLYSNYNSLTFGGNIKIGLVFNVSPRFYLTAITGMRLSSSVLLKQTHDYQSELYKEHLPVYERSKLYYSNFDYFSSIGLNFRF